MNTVLIRALQTISTPAGLITRGGTALVSAHWAHECAARGLVEIIEHKPVTRQEFNAPSPIEIASPLPEIETREDKPEVKANEAKPKTRKKKAKPEKK